MGRGGERVVGEDFVVGGAKEAWQADDGEIERSKDLTLKRVAVFVQNHSATV